VTAGAGALAGGSGASGAASASTAGAAFAAGAERFDVAVVGGGIVGMATALALARGAPRSGERGSVVVLEAEDRLAAHQSGHNSGVIHSGIYYKPGSLKAVLCARGRELMVRFCAEQGVPHERCGKVIIATGPAELPALEELERRGQANGLRSLRRLSPAELREREPHATAHAALLVEETGITDYVAVTQAMARLLQGLGGEVRTGWPLLAAAREPDGLRLVTPRGEIACRGLVNCAGLQSDRVARRCGVEPGVAIVPFRGEYKLLRPERRPLVRHLIYPVPDPRYPFLGVHFTRGVDGQVEAGPNAVLAWSRHGYARGRLQPRDAAALLGSGGFWRMAARHWRTGCMEVARSLSTERFARSLQALVPEVRAEDLLPGPSGVRAQAVDPSGALLDDFRLVEAPRMLHVLNAPSPGATASLAIGEHLAEAARRIFAGAAGDPAALRP